MCDDKSVCASAETVTVGTDDMSSSSYINLPLSFIAQELGFQNLQEADKFLNGHGAAIYTTPKSGVPMAGKTGSTGQLSSKTLDCKSTHATLMQAHDTLTRRVTIRGAI